MSKIGRIAGKVNEKFDETLEDLSLTDPDQAEDASERDDPDQEYYDARSPEQIQEGGMVILTKGQVEGDEHPDGDENPGTDGNPDTDAPKRDDAG